MQDVSAISFWDMDPYVLREKINQKIMDIELMLQDVASPDRVKWFSELRLVIIVQDEFCGGGFVFRRESSPPIDHGALLAVLIEDFSMIALPGADVQYGFEFVIINKLLQAGAPVSYLKLRSQGEALIVFFIYIGHDYSKAFF